jgi:hypothetical protein
MLVGFTNPREQRRWASYLRVARGKRVHAIFGHQSIDSLASRELSRRGDLDRLSRGIPIRSVPLGPRGRFSHDFGRPFVISQAEEHGST